MPGLVLYLNFFRCSGLALGRNLHSSSSLFSLESHNDHCIYCSISRPLRELQYVRTPHSADDRSSTSVPLCWIVLSSLIRLLPSIVQTEYRLRYHARASLAIELGDAPARHGATTPAGIGIRSVPGEVLARISLECRCFIFAPRLRVVCPTADSWRSFLVGEVRDAFRQTCLEASWAVRAAYADCHAPRALGQRTTGEKPVFRQFTSVLT
jgi:hypothetical protein